MTDGRFSGRVAIVTGSSSGIGLAVAKRLVSEGCRLLLIASPEDEDDLARAVALLGAHAVGMPSDVSAESTAASAVERCTETFGRLDYLVNNAGVAYYEELLATPVAHLDRTFAVNLRGAFLLSVAAASAMTERGGGGVIVNTTSTAAFVGEQYQATYNAIQGAVAAMTRALAVDLAPLGVRVNAVAPGWVETRSTARIVADPSQWSKHRSRIPMDRVATPDEIAGVYVFLLSDDASYVTGSVIACDGGMLAGYRFSDWEAVIPGPDGLQVGIPSLPSDLHASTP